MESDPPQPSQKARSSGGRRVLIFAGATGGHLFPAVSFAQEYLLQFPDSKMELVSSHRAAALLRGRWENVFHRVHYWHSFPLTGRLSFQILISLCSMLLAFLRAFVLVLKSKPDVSVGFGSYISFPGILISRVLRVPCVLHEQNRTPGKATRYLCRWAGLRLSSFPHTFGTGEAYERTIGLPLRRSLLGSEDRSLSDRGKDQPFYILILGGSQGSHRLNEVLLEAFSQFSDEEKSRLAVNHITGFQDAEKVKKSYENLKIHAQTFAFFDRMEDLYRSSHFAVTRAGANTLFELAYFGVPALVVPYPYAGHHQKDNADYFASHGACLTKVESNLSAAAVSELIRMVLSSPEILKRMSCQMKKLAVPEAGRAMVLEVEKYLELSR